MSGGPPNRIVTFSEVMFVPYAWQVSEPPNFEGFFIYNYFHDSGPSTITITRSDGKVLSFEPREDYYVEMRENVIRFVGIKGHPAGEPFK